MRITTLIASAALVAILVSKPSEAAPCAGFVDVEDTSPFCSSIEWVKNRGITRGCTATEYCPDASATRAQMAAFLSRMAPMLLPALTDENDVLFGYLTYAGDYRGTGPIEMRPFAAINGGTGVHYLPMSQFIGASQHGFSWGPPRDLHFALPGCDPAGKVWAQHNDVPVFARWAVVAGNGHVYGAVQSVASMTFASVLQASNGVCLNMALTVTAAYLYEMTNLGLTASGFYYLR